MTGNQIKHILSEIGYSTSENVLLDLTKISCIVMNQDSRLYPDLKNKRFAFNYSANCIEVFEGRTKGGDFIMNNENGYANHIVSFNNIAGFIQTSKLLPNGQIMYREFESNMTKL